MAHLPTPSIKLYEPIVGVRIDTERDSVVWKDLPWNVIQIQASSDYLGAREVSKEEVLRVPGVHCYATDGKEIWSGIEM